MLLIDAVISPAGTGIVYVGTTARLSYALGEEREMPSALAPTNKKGVPVVSILVAAVVGLLAFGPFKSWNALVNVVTGATAIMYAFAPVSLAALHKLDRRPAALVPRADAGARAAGRVLLGEPDHLLGRLRDDVEAGPRDGRRAGAVRDRRGAQSHRTRREITRNAIWMGPWLGGHVVIGWLGRYGGGRNILPELGRHRSW